MRSPTLILGILLSSSLVAQGADRPATGGGVGGPRTAPKAATKTSSQVANLLKIASDLRASGRHDIAAAIEQQAKRLWTTTDTTGPRAAASAPSQVGPLGPARVRLPYAQRPDVPSKPASPSPGPRGPATLRPVDVPRPAGVPATDLPSGVAAPQPVRAGVAAVPPGPARGPDARTIGKAPYARHGKEYSRRFPQIDRRPELGVMDEGRSRYKIMPTPTERDANGRVGWGGLPSDRPRTTAERRTEQDLQQRVARLQQDVQEMSRLLDKLHKELEKQDRKRRMR